jgi:hypothetical protein
MHSITGISTFLSDINQMTGWKPSLLLKSHIVVMISTLSPIVITIILVKDVWGLIADENVITYGKYIYPSWGQWIGWSLALLSIVAIPCGAVHHMIYVFTSGNICENLKSTFRPTKLWRQNAELNLALSSNSLNSITSGNTKRMFINDAYVNCNIPSLNIYESNGVINPAFIS